MAGFIEVRRIIAGLCAACAAIAVTPDAAAYQPAALLIVQDDHLWQTSPIDGSFTEPWHFGWANTTSFVTNGYDVYTTTGQGLYRLQLDIGAWFQLGADEWSGTTKLAFGWRQDIKTPFLWAIQVDTLYRIELGHGTPTTLGGRVWASATSMAYLDYNSTLNDLFIIQGGSLWRVNSNTGAYGRLGAAGAWSGETAITAFNKRLYIYQDSRLWQVSPSNGARTQLGGADWAGTTSMTGWNGSLYVVQDDHLFRVDPNNGAFEPLGGADWGGPTFIGTITERP